MSKLNRPLSLTQHFDAPGDFIGRFGWVCGYSADSQFLDDAVGRFTGESALQRSSDGRVALALILDPGNDQIKFTDAPGVLHLLIKDRHNKPFASMHAKFAILGFREISDGDHWHLRLLVSTGNWTRETLENSLDLIWRIDISSDDIAEPDDDIVQKCADFKAAWGLLSWLRERYDLRALSPAIPSNHTDESSKNRMLLEGWASQVSRKAKRLPPRFLHNRTESLLSQLPNMVEATGRSVARNYLVIGSGFYQSEVQKHTVPSVIQGVVTSLNGEAGGPRLLTSSPVMHLIVNPLACQAVASSLEALSADGWKVLPAAQPKGFGKLQRALHAKFIFSANRRDDSELLSSAWLYIGSGNLTNPGFARKMSNGVGNLEAGVIFSPGQVYRDSKRNSIPAEQILTNLLPIPGDETETAPITLLKGTGMPEQNTYLLAAPVAYLIWIDDGSKGWLQTPTEKNDTGEESVMSTNFCVIDNAGSELIADATGRFCWRLARPRQVQVRWKDGADTLQCAVPVVDSFGRFAAQELVPIDIDQAWSQLSAFPMAPDDEDLPPDDEQGNCHVLGSEHSKAAKAAPAMYPLRRMMEFIENIAAKQTAVSQADWSAWCVRLEQCLVQSRESSALKSVCDLGLNPLSPLWMPPFRPAFAETDETEEGRRYEEALKKIEAHWNVAGKLVIGEAVL